MILVTKFIWFPPAPAQANFDAGHTALYLVTFLALTLIASDLNYRFIETPLRRFGETLAARRRAPLSAAQG